MSNQLSGHFKSPRRGWVFVLGTLVLAMTFLIADGSLAANRHHTKTKLEPVTEYNADESEKVSESAAPAPEPSHKGIHCDGQNSSLLATLMPSDADDRHLLCAVNGMDAIHRFAKVGGFPREKILSDYKNKLSEDFQISPGLMKRVGFWFDVYTKYPSYIRILHHTRYPWIQYHEINLTDFLVQPKALWMNVTAAEKFVMSEKRRIEAQLSHLAKMKNYDHLSSDEHYLFDLLSEIPGPRSKVFREAAHQVRVQTGQMDFFVEGLIRKTQYLSGMETIFREAGLPTELTRLPLVESSFNANAVSKVGAAGVWQFMQATARPYMKVTPDIDERRSPMKAAVGAARYLAATYRMLYHNWPLTIVAYNHGPGGVRKAVRAANSENMATIIDRYETRSFSFATKNYLPEFLAALYAEKYQSDIFGPLQQLTKVESEVVVLQRSIRPSELARQLRLPLNVIYGYNLDIQTAIEHNKPLPSGYNLHLPRGYVARLSSKDFKPLFKRRG